jgi:hypothetical protein
MWAGIFLILSLLLLFNIFSFNDVFAQSSSSKSPTSAQLEECKQLGIEPEKCSEKAILSKNCIYPDGSCTHSYSGIPKDDPNISLIPVYIGIAGAFVAGIVYVKKTGKWKAKVR